MKFGRQTYGGDRPIATAQPIMTEGGYNLDQSANSFDEGVIIPAGSLVAFDEAARTAKVLKAARVTAIDGSDAKIVTLESDQFIKPTFKVGESVLKTVSGTSNFADAPTITAIDKSNGGFKVTLSAEISGLAVGDAIFQVISNGASTPKAVFIATSFQGMVIADSEVKASGSETSIDVTLDSGVGSFYAHRIPPIYSGHITGNVLKDNHNIKLTNSY